MKWLVLAVLVLLPSLVGALAFALEKQPRVGTKLITVLVGTAMGTSLLTLWYPLTDDWFLTLLSGYSFPLIALACLTPFVISVGIPVLTLRFFVVKRPIANLRGLFLLLLPVVGVLLVVTTVTAAPVAKWAAGIFVFGLFRAAYPYLYGWLGGAKPFSPSEAERTECLKLVRQAKARVSFAVLPVNGLNAFAVGNGFRRGTIFLTSGLVDRATSAERLAIIAHEVAHIRHLDWITLQIPEFVFALILGVMLSFEPSATAWFIFAVAAFVLKTWIVSPLYLLLEFRADAYAAKVVGDRQLFADALKKVVGNGPAQVGLFGPTHPQLQRRLQRLSTLP